MARGTQFSQLVYMLRAEVRRSVSSNVGVDDLPDLKQAINRQYAIMTVKHDWPFLEKYFATVPLATGQRYYQPPTGLVYDRIKAAAVYFSGVPQRLERGISFEDYALFDPDALAYSDPVLKFDIRTGSASQEQIEVWPVPSSNAQYLRFFGYVATPPLINDADLCWIDDMLVVLFAAADVLALDMSEPRVGLPPAAQLKLAVAKEYEALLVANAATHRAMIAIGQGRPQRGVNTDNLVRVRG